MPQDLKSRQRQEREAQWVRGILAQWQLRDQYGKIVITLQDGFITHVEEQKMNKPPANVIEGLKIIPKSS